MMILKRRLLTLISPCLCLDEIVEGITESDVHCTSKQGREIICQPDFIDKIIVHCQMKQLT